MGKRNKRKTCATPANVPRSRSSMTRRQRKAYREFLQAVIAFGEAVDANMLECWNGISNQVINPVTGGVHNPPWASLPKEEKTLGSPALPMQVQIHRSEMVVNCIDASITGDRLAPVISKCLREQAKRIDAAVFGCIKAINSPTANRGNISSSSEVLDMALALKRIKQAEERDVIRQRIAKEAVDTSLADKLKRARP